MERRNLCIGDVCVVKDSNALRGEWRLAKVTACYPDTKGKVRNVELMVKPKQGGKGAYVSTAPVYLKRHVNSLILLVPSDENDLDENQTVTT